MSRWRSNDQQPATLGRTLERFLAQMGAPPVKTLGTIHDRWAEIVGPALAQHSRPIEVLDGVLQIGCDEASWASQIGWMDDQIKRRCAEVFDGLTIVRVRVSVTPAGAP